MKRHVFYECETCGKKSEDMAEIIACEAAHLGLTVAEKKEWEALEQKMRKAADTVSCSSNEETQRAFDDAVDEILRFEKVHNLSK
ncbi:hypothetical protein [Eubacterium ramulus]|uniref:hypothetical protein n=1 Tax=Eubacterium ramulus TaxID=39490 RepID=UPI0022E3843F|nr:hypothetical protein [Eubacterium ramulus]